MLPSINLADLTRIMAEGINQVVSADLAAHVAGEKTIAPKSSNYGMKQETPSQTMAGVAV